VIVTGHGLAVAAESLVARCPVPVELDLEIGDRPPEVVEVAAYYLLAEALTNVAKHAHASRATVEVKRSNGRLVVEVTDDGVGGADVAAGTGLRASPIASRPSAAISG
jgi:signal transduction histidine kinase